MKADNRIRPNKMKSAAGEADVSNASVFRIDFMQSLDLGIKLILTIVGVCLVTLFYIFIHDFATQSTYFKIKKISLNGADTLERMEILDQAGVGLADNLLFINIFKVKKKLTAHSWIQEASVIRAFPGELIINIREHQALAVAKIGNTGDVVINTKGMPFKEYDSEKDLSRGFLPVVTGLELTQDQAGYCFSENLLNPVVSLLCLENRRKITHVHADADTGLEIKTDSPCSISAADVTLKLGFGNYTFKLKKMDQIFDYVHRHIFDKTVASIDLFNLENVTIAFNPGEKKADQLKGGV